MAAAAAYDTTLVALRPPTPFKLHRPLTAELFVLWTSADCEVSAAAVGVELFRVVVLCGEDELKVEVVAVLKEGARLADLAGSSLPPREWCILEVVPLSSIAFVRVRAAAVVTELGPFDDDDDEADDEEVEKDLADAME